MEMSLPEKTDVDLIDKIDYRLMFDAIPQLIWLGTSEGDDIHFNSRWQEATGLSVEMLEQGWRNLIYSADMRELLSAFDRTLREHQTVECRLRLLHRGGQFRWMLFRSRPFMQACVTASRWIGTCTDIHDEVVMQEELHEASLRKDEFMALLAHELRNPMAPISTAAQMLKLDPGNRERVVQASGIISRQVAHMGELVNDLLDVSRVVQGIISLEMSTVDMFAVVAAGVEQSKPVIDSKSHELVVDMPSGPLYVQGDKSRLIQVVANLLNNAAKYTPDRGKIILAIQVYKNEIRLVVEDNGHGIDPSMLPKIFKLFAQAARTPERTQGGLGLGLPLIRSIVVMHEGKVEAFSQGRGRGSSFIVTLPRICSASEAPEN
jgi:PAS domain S-box-containing protein